MDLQVETEGIILQRVRQSDLRPLSKTEVRTVTLGENPAGSACSASLKSTSLPVSEVIGSVE